MGRLVGRRALSRCITHHAGAAAALSQLATSTGPEPDPYAHTTYWASGHYGFERLGFFRVDPGTELTLPESITLPGGPAVALNLEVDFQDPWDMVFTQTDARILIEGEVWQDWWPWQVDSGGQRILNAATPETAASWPPPGGDTKVELRTTYHANPTRPDGWDYFGWVHVRRYAISITTLA